MLIVGRSETDDEGGIETIDVWYSDRRKRWIVERLDAAGHQVGVAHACASEDEAWVCLEEWLRAHSETRLVAPRQTTSAEQKLLHRHAA